MACRKWSDKETKHLVSLIGQGMNDTQIGLMMFRPKEQVTEKRAELAKQTNQNL